MANAMKPKPKSAGTGSDLGRLADLAETDMEQVVPYSGRGLEADAARHYRSEAALFLSTGFAANAGLFAIPGIIFNKSSIGPIL